MKLFYTSAILALSTSLVAASPVEVGKRKDWVPQVLYPHTGTVWVVGTHHNVTWSLANAPSGVTFPIGEIFLSKGGKIVTGAGGVDDPLAAGFDLHKGRIEVQVPNVTTGNDYAITLFVADSEIESQQFRIQHAFIRL